MIWRHFTVDMAVGLPLAEWAYVTPWQPDGLPTSDLTSAASVDQTEVARFWFLSNYEPFINHGHWFGFGPGSVGFGQGSFAPERWTPSDILSDEFGNILPEGIISDLAMTLEAHAGLWISIPDPPQIHFSVAEDKLTQDGVIEALNRLEKAVQNMANGGIGHNRGPQILDEQGQADLISTIGEVRLGVEKGQTGASDVSHARIKLVNILKVVGAALAFEFIKKVGDDAYDPTKHLGIQLFHYLYEAIIALGHWLASLAV